MSLYHGKRIYEGDPHDGDPFRRAYLSSLQAWIEGQYEQARQKRETFLPTEDLPRRAAHYRQLHLHMIGSPAASYPLQPPACTQTPVGRDDFGTIYRLQLEVLPGLQFYGILMIPHGAVRAPLVIAQHGGGGTPELCSDFAGENAYGCFTKRALERGMVVFAPQLLLWKVQAKEGEETPVFDIPYRRTELDQKLRHLGLSITGMEVFCLRRSLDWLQMLPCVDPVRIGMMGLSYGGYFALHTAAADTRIKAVYAAGFFNDRTRVWLEDWIYPNSAAGFSDAEVAALIAPRRLQIDVGRSDGVFDDTYAEAEAQRVRRYYEAYGAAEQFAFTHWPGGHRFEESGKGFEFFFSGL